MTRIALIRQHYRPDGGGERAVMRFQASLAADSDITVICRDWQGAPADSVILVNPPYRNRVTRERGFAQAVSNLKALAEFDVVQSHERIPGVSLYRAGDGVHAEWLRAQAPFVSGLKRWWLTKDRFHRYLLDAERDMFTHPNLRAVICNSHMVKAQIIKHFNVAPDKLHVIYNCTDPREFNPESARARRQLIRQELGIEAEVPVAIFVGSGFFRKGLRFALQAIALTDAHHLIVVGHDKHLKRYRKLAVKLGLAGRVHFTGVQSELAPYYGAADMLLHPAIYEPYPNVAIEALSCGLPILVSTNTGAAETVEAFGCGKVVACSDISALATSLREVDKMLMSYREKALSAARSFSEARMLGELQALYEKLLGRPR